MTNLETNKTKKPTGNYYYSNKPKKLTSSGFTSLQSVNDKWNYLDPERLWYIYRHIRLDTGGPFYIGVGKKASFTSPRQEYRRAHDVDDRNDFWKRVVDKSGYEVEIMVEDLTYEESRGKEKELVSLLKILQLTRYSGAYFDSAF